jgi:hypothetical protein
VRVLLVSLYELGHQPLHVASPAARLRGDGHEVRCLDLAVDGWDPELVDWAGAVGLSVPMHTAMRLAVRAAREIGRRRPGLPVCLYGLYAPVSRDLTVGRVAARVIAGEYEPALAAWVGTVAAGGDPAEPGAPELHLDRGGFSLPARDLLPPLDRYARLAVGGDKRAVGYVEATHGCRHRCRHCPLPVVYDGVLRALPRELVLEDVAQLVEMGAEHITFGDPDFLNGPTHALRIGRALHERFPDLTFDCTTKVEHVLRHANVWSELAACGCLFVVSAFEAVDDAVLDRLDKGHTAADAAAAVALLREHGIEPRPTFLPFTPWTTVEGVIDLLDFVAGHGLVENVDPVQYTIRLLLPDGSLLLDHPDMRPHLGPYDPEALGWTWSAPDPAVDLLQARIAALVEDHAGRDAPISETFAAVRALALDAAGRSTDDAPEACTVASSPTPVPRLTEPWFCCAEPTCGQLAQLTRD